MTTPQSTPEYLARADAADAIQIARTEPGPVTFITGNNFMPPLRAFGHAEHVWQNDDTQFGTDWETYFETFETALADANVYLDCPDYDNALYVVDLARFQPAEDPDGDFLDGEWEPI